MDMRYKGFSICAF